MISGFRWRAAPVEVKAWALSFISVLVLGYGVAGLQIWLHFGFPLVGVPPAGHEEEWGEEGEEGREVVVLLRDAFLPAAMAHERRAPVPAATPAAGEAEAAEHPPGHLPESSSAGLPAHPAGAHPSEAAGAVPEETFLYLAQYTHIHIFGMAVLFFLAGGLFLGTTVAPRMKCALYVVANAAILVDLGSLWLKHYVSPVFEVTLMAAGTAMAACFVVFTARTVWEIFSVSPGLVPQEDRDDRER